MTAYEQIEAKRFVTASGGVIYVTPESKGDGVFVKASDYDALLAAVKALAEDAERYRWLRNEHHPGPLEPRTHRIDQNFDPPQCLFCHGEELDSAVDAARQSTTSAGEKP